MEREIRDKWLNVRLTDAEYKKILKNYSGTTHAKLSDYSRAILLRKPIIALSEVQIS